MYPIEHAGEIVTYFRLYPVGHYYFDSVHKALPFGICLTAELYFCHVTFYRFTVRLATGVSGVYDQ